MKLDEDIQEYYLADPELVPVVAATGANRKRGPTMSLGVALQAREGTTPKGSTSYEQFMQAGVAWETW